MIYCDEENKSRSQKYVQQYASDTNQISLTDIEMVSLFKQGSGILLACRAQRIRQHASNTTARFDERIY